MTHIITIKLDSEALAKSLLDAVADHIKYSGFSNISIDVNEVVEPVVPPPIDHSQFYKEAAKQVEPAAPATRSFMTDDEIPF